MIEAYSKIYCRKLGSLKQPCCLNITIVSMALKPFLFSMTLLSQVTILAALCFTCSFYPLPMRKTTHLEHVPPRRQL